MSEKQEGFSNTLTTMLIGYEDVVIDDPLDPPVRTERRPVWGGIDSNGTFGKTYDRGKTWIDITERNAPWEVNWTKSFAIGGGRVVVPGVYNPDYPLAETSGWTSNGVIAGYLPRTNNPVFNLMTMDDVLSCVYLGNDRVMYYDFFSLTLVTPGKIDSFSSNSLPLHYYCGAYDRNPASSLGDVSVGENDELNGKLVYSEVSHYFVGPNPGFTIENLEPFWINTNNYFFGGDAFTFMTRYSTSGTFPLLNYPYWMEIQDVPRVGVGFWGQVITSEAGHSDYKTLKDRFINKATDTVAKEYCSKHGFKIEGTTTGNNGGSIIYNEGRYPANWGPNISGTFMMTVFGKIDNGKIVPESAKITGYQLSGGSNGIADLGGFPASTSLDEHSRRCVTVFPKHYLGNGIVLAELWMGAIRGETIVPSSRTLSGDRLSLYSQTQPAYPGTTQPPGWPPPGPSMSGGPMGTTIEECPTSSVDPNSYHKRIAISTDFGETWGPNLTIDGVEVGGGVAQKVIPIGEGRGVLVINKMLYEISSAGFKKIDLVEDATYISSATGAITGRNVRDVIKCMRAPDQFFFEIDGLTGPEVILSYENYTKMKRITDNTLIEEDPPSPYFVPTFAGGGLDSFPEDFVYPYTDIVVPEFVISEKVMISGFTQMLYRDSIEAGGGNMPYRFFKESGDLPPGLVLDEKLGYITGTPTQTGEFKFSVGVEDSTIPVKRVVRGNFAITISEGYVEPLTFDVDLDLEIPEGRVGLYYGVTMKVTGGKPPYIWSASGLPSWASIDQNYGLIVGFPTSAHASFPTITVVDSRNPSNSISGHITILVHESDNDW
jgi:hypothetical protein